MSGMLEKLARALCKEDGTDPDWEGPDPSDPSPAWRNYLGSVRAVLAVLREPSDEVSERMSEHAGNGMVDWRDLHREMIDAILNEPKG